MGRKNMAPNNEDNIIARTLADTSADVVKIVGTNEARMNEFGTLNAGASVFSKTKLVHETSMRHHDTRVDPGSCDQTSAGPYTPFSQGSIGKRKYETIVPGIPTAEPDTEAGLELLFAASLIQQKDESNKQPSARALSSCSENDSATGDSSLYPSLEMAGPSDFVEPNDRDVLCGRGGFINKHVGNIVYRKVVDFNKTIYRQVPKRHRILVSQSIVQTIQKYGGRFLQPASGLGKQNPAWAFVPYRRAVQKTSQALREPSLDGADTAGGATAVAASKEDLVASEMSKTAI